MLKLIVRFTYRIDANRFFVEVLLEISCCQSYYSRACSIQELEHIKSKRYLLCTQLVIQVIVLCNKCRLCRYGCHKIGSTFMQTFGFFLHSSPSSFDWKVLWKCLLTSSRLSGLLLQVKINVVFSHISSDLPIFSVLQTKSIKFYQNQSEF